MKNFLVSLLSLGLLKVSVLAEPTANPKPVFMQQMMPKDAETRFFGEVEFPTPVHNRYFLHFYEFPQTPLVMSDNDGVDKDYMADLFSQPIGKRQTKYRLVSRLKFDRSYFEHEVSKFDFVKARFMWLVPAKRQGPILHITCTVTNGFYGPFGEDILFVFDKGFNAKPVPQGFYNYGNHSDNQAYAFDKIDNRGYRIVSSYSQSSGSDYRYEYAFSWNGQGFIQQPEPVSPPPNLQ